MDANQPIEKPESNKNHNPKRFKKLLFILIPIILVFAIVLVVLSINKSQDAKKVSAYLDGKVFLIGQYDNLSATILSFKGGTVAYEKWIGEDIHGSITEYMPYDVDASIFRDTFIVDYADGGYGLYLDDSGIVHFSMDENDWTEITLQEVENLRQLRFKAVCEHTFTEHTITEASCSAKGEASFTCTKCQYSEVRKTDMLPHNYVNKVCSVCGAKEAKQKSDLKANTWYIHDDILHYQNCLIHLAQALDSSGAISVMYYPVCQHCHAVDDYSMWAVPEIDSPIEKIHTCDVCDKTTVVKLKIE